MKPLGIFAICFISMHVEFVLNHFKVSCRLCDILLMSSILLQNLEVSGHGDLHPHPTLSELAHLLTPTAFCS